MADTFSEHQWMGVGGEIKHVLDARLIGGIGSNSFGASGLLADPDLAATVDPNFSFIIEETVGAKENFSATDDSQPIDTWSPNQWLGIAGEMKHTVDSQMQGALGADSFAGQAGEFGKLLADPTLAAVLNPNFAFIIEETVGAQENFSVVDDIPPAFTLSGNSFAGVAGDIKLMPDSGYFLSEFAGILGEWVPLIDPALGNPLPLPPVPPIPLDLDSIVRETTVTPFYRVMMGRTPPLADLDITEHLAIDEGIRLNWRLDYPDLAVFLTSDVRLMMDNREGLFDVNNNMNLFVQQSLPQHGDGIELAVRVGFDEIADKGAGFTHLREAFLFAGKIGEIATSTNDTQAEITLLDPSRDMRNGSVEVFGAMRAGLLKASDDYHPWDPVWEFPDRGAEISQNSVIVSAPAGVSIVQSIRTEGAGLSFSNAEIEYNTGLLRFELPPAGGSGEVVIASWKQNYRWRRPDFLVRKLLEHIGFYDRFADVPAEQTLIERVKLTHLTQRWASSHGRPSEAGNIGVVRNMVRDETDIAPDGSPNVLVYLLFDQNLVRYDQYEDEYTTVGTLPQSGGVDMYGYGLATLDYVQFYVIACSEPEGDSSLQAGTSGQKISIYKWAEIGGFFEIANESDKFCTLAHPTDYAGTVDPLADVRKTFIVIEDGGTQYLYFVFAEPSTNSPARAGLRRFNATTGLVDVVFSRNYNNAGETRPGMEYGYNFLIIGTTIWHFFCYDDGAINVNGTFVVYTSTLTGTSQTLQLVEDYPDTQSYRPGVATDLSYDSINNKIYFVLSEQHTSAITGRGGVNWIPTNGTPLISRTELTVYANVTHAPRGGVYDGAGSTWFFEGGPHGTLHNLPGEEYSTGSPPGRLISIDGSNDVTTGHGLIWRSAVSPDPTDPKLDGWGVHTGITSNMLLDGDGNFHFVAGYGSPIDLTGTAQTVDVAPINESENYVWLQFGYQLSSKIAELRTNGQAVWNLLQELARASNFEMGFESSPTESFETASRFFFRSRNPRTGILKTTLDIGTIDEIELEDGARFPIPDDGDPVPDEGTKEFVIIEEEVFSYQSGGGTVLQEVQRAEFGSAIVDHSPGAIVYQIDAVAANFPDYDTLVSIAGPFPDYENIYNRISVSHGGRTTVSFDSSSIDEHGARQFPVVDAPLLSRHDHAWAELIGDEYLKLFKDLQQRVEVVMKLTPNLKVGDCLLTNETGRLGLKLRKVKVLEVSHDTLRMQTTIVGRTIN